MNAVNQVQEASAVYAVEQHALLKSFDLLATAPGGVARLRELILSLAVQGKLVPQDPNDEPASVLLERVRAEKQALIKVGKLKKDKPLAEISEEEKPFELPQRWEWMRLGALALKLTDGSHNPPKDAERGYPMLSSQNVLDGKISFSNPSRYLSSQDFESENQRTDIKTNDVLLTIVASLGRSAVVPNDAPQFALQRSVAVISTRLNPQYLSMYLRSRYAKGYYLEHGKGTAQKGIYLGQLGQFLVPIPPLEEQPRIVARVEELMQLCDALEQQGKLEAVQHARLVSTLFDALANSESAHALAENWQRVAATFDLLLDRPEAVDALEQTLLQLAVRGLLVPQDPKDEPASELLKKIRTEKDHLIATGKLKREKPLPEITEEEKPFELPNGWEWARVGQFGVTATGGTPASSKPEYFGNQIPFIGPGQITEGGAVLLAEKYLSELGRTETEIAEVGDILMVCIGGSIGKCAISSSELAFNQQINSIRLVAGVSEYVYLAMRSSDFRKMVIQTATGSATPIISKGKWDTLPLPIPPLAEQSRIVACVAELRHLCADLRARLSAARSTQTRLAEALVEKAA